MLHSPNKNILQIFLYLHNLIEKLTKIYLEVLPFMFVQKGQFLEETRILLFVRKMGNGQKMLIWLVFVGVF
ncbi:unnamed protein product [Meloidogyne enterolobii]|uniref:Uncharacterized protein n=1 Tax=Meloidogyne enterolobii TaxID=390850 RepID=A0ACB1A1Y6_MELEN